MLQLQGQISKYELFGIYTRLAREKSVGTLLLRNRKHNSALYFNEGKIIFANVNIRRDRIGEILIREDKITHEQLEKALILQREQNNNIRVGRILIKNFDLDPDGLIEAIRKQILTVVEDIFDWSNMSYQFLENVFPSKERITVRVSIENVILKEARKIDLWEDIKKVLPSFDAVLRITEAPSGYSRNIEMLAEEWNILRLVNGYSTIKEIYQNSNMNEFEVCKILYRLISAGIVERVPEASHTKLSSLEKKIDRLSRLLSMQLKEEQSKDEIDLIDFGEF